MNVQNYWINKLILEILAEGADCALSVSGGKDSQALLASVVAWLRSQGYTGTMFAIFADLGRAEWPQTLPFLTQLCRSLEVELVVVRRAKGDLLDRFDERRASLQDTAPFWPSTKAKYCTSDLKRQPIDQYLRRRSPLILSIEGIRAQESDARAEKNPFTLRRSITGQRYQERETIEHTWHRYQTDLQGERARVAQLPLFTDVSLAHAPTRSSHTLPRLAFTWYPLFDWSIEDVWHACGTSQEELTERRQLYRAGIEQQDASVRDRALAGWPMHPAYVMGARRLSCSLCFMADWFTLEAGARHNPDYYRALCWREIESGYSFQMNRWLSDVAPDLLTDEMRFLLAQHPRRQQWLERSLQRAQRKAARSSRKPRPALPIVNQRTA